MREFKHRSRLVQLVLHVLLAFVYLMLHLLLVGVVNSTGWGEFPIVSVFFALLGLVAFLAIACHYQQSVKEL